MHAETAVLIPGAMRYRLSGTTGPWNLTDDPAMIQRICETRGMDLKRTYQTESLFAVEYPASTPRTLNRPVDDNNYQMRLARWMDDTFEPEVCADTRERGHRFGEEAIELLQANGATKEEVYRLVEYVYGRPVGEVGQEVGGVMVTLAALCETYKVDLMSLAWKELLRVETPEVQNKIRAKQASKRAMLRYSPLPGHE